MQGAGITGMAIKTCGHDHMEPYSPDLKGHDVRRTGILSALKVLLISQ
jgi:hypothetical protein